MRKILFLAAAIAVVISFPVSAEGPIVAGGEQPAYKVWIAEPYATWQEAMATMILIDGDAIMMKTGDPETPIVLVRQVTTSGIIQIKNPKYHASNAMTSMSEMASYVAGHSWWRGVTTADGAMIVVTRTDQ